MPIPEALQGLPLADMILRAIADPGAFVRRNRSDGGRREPVTDWRARAVWEAMEECGIDPTRAFVSEEAMRAFDDSEHSTRAECPICGSTDPEVRQMVGTGSPFRCDDAVRWHALRATGSSA